MLLGSMQSIIATSGNNSYPWDYRVQYIKCDTSTKGAYITTGITNENGIRCVARVRCPMLNGKPTPMASVIFCGSTRFGINFCAPDYSASQCRLQFMWGSGNAGTGFTQQIAAPMDDFFDLDCELFSRNQKVSINGVKTYSSTIAMTSYSLDGSEIRMFNYHSPNSDRYAYNSIASLKLLNAQDEVLFNGIPCVKNGVPALFDTEGKEFHFNAGSGMLNAGPRVNDDGSEMRTTPRYKKSGIASARGGGVSSMLIDFWVNVGSSGRLPKRRNYVPLNSATHYKEAA